MKIDLSGSDINYSRIKSIRDKFNDTLKGDD